MSDTLITGIPSSLNVLTTTGEWRLASELRAGDKIVFSHGGSAVLKENRTHDIQIDMYALCYEDSRYLPVPLTYKVPILQSELSEQFLDPPMVTNELKQCRQYAVQLSFFLYCTKVKWVTLKDLFQKKSQDGVIDEWTLPLYSCLDAKYIAFSAKNLPIRAGILGPRDIGKEIGGCLRDKNLFFHDRFITAMHNQRLAFCSGVLTTATIEYDASIKMFYVDATSKVIALQLMQLFWSLGMMSYFEDMVEPQIGEFTRVYFNGSVLHGCFRERPDVDRYIENINDSDIHGLRLIDVQSLDRQETVQELIFDSKIIPSLCVANGFLPIYGGTEFPEKVGAVCRMRRKENKTPVYPSMRSVQMRQRIKDAILMRN